MKQSNVIVAVAGALVLSVFGGCMQQEDPNKIVAHIQDSLVKVQEAKRTSMNKFYEVVINGNNMAAAGDYMHANAQDHQIPAGQTNGLEGFKQQMQMLRHTFPDLKITPEHTWVDGDHVIAHVRMTGTNKGPLFGKGEPTGRSVDVRGVDIVRLENGKAVEHWGYYDNEAMMQQLGLSKAPTAPAPPKKNS